MEENKQLLSPKLDIVFHALFREENKDLLGELITDVLKERVKVITTDKNRQVNIKTAEEKYGIMDLRAELAGGIKCNIEIQLEQETYEKERILYYWADAYSRQMNKSDEYVELKKTISIVILGHEIKEMRGIEKLGAKWQIRDEESGKRVLTDRLEIVIIELPKAKRIYEKNKKDRIGQWMMFLDNPNNKEVSKIMSSNKEIEKAFEELEQVSGNEELRRLAELRIKGIRDKKAQIDYAKQEGIKEGIEKGMKQEREKRDTEIVKKMLKKKISMEDIIEITVLSKEEIEKISKI